MIETEIINTTISKLGRKKVVNYILNKRYCLKHAKKSIGKKGPVTQIVGFCNKCRKAGLVYYLDN